MFVIIVSKLEENYFFLLNEILFLVFRFKQKNEFLKHYSTNSLPTVSNYYFACLKLPISFIRDLIHINIGYGVQQIVLNMDSVDINIRKMRIHINPQHSRRKWQWIQSVHINIKFTTVLQLHHENITFFGEYLLHSIHSILKMK